MTNQRLMQSRRVLLLLMLMIVGVWSGCGTKIKIHTEKYDNGKMSGEANYIDGKKEGKYVEYYESGTVKYEGNYVDGKQEGKWILYDEEGNTIFEYCWVMGELLNPA